MRILKNEISIVLEAVLADFAYKLLENKYQITPYASVF